jgi:dihydroxyacetone kinase-like protein
VKKFVNDVATVVQESIAGLGAAHADLVSVDPTRQLVLRAGAPIAGKVALVAGGGSGHEPLHAGFVGKGMLDAACPGAVFTAPVPDQIMAATSAVDGGAGVVHIVSNYAGDVMNFKLAAEEAEDEGVEIASVLTNDDVATEATVGRRGVGGTVLVERIAGAKAEAGGSLTEVASVGRRVNEQARSFGVALSSCTTPAAGRPTFDLGPDEMEFGVGIHGEPGRRREKMRNAAEIVAEMTEAVLVDLDPPSGADVLALVNGLGGTPLLELYLVYNELVQLLEERGLRIARNLVGNYVTSLEMAGVSITILVLDDELTALWDSPVHTPALRWGA